MSRYLKVTLLSVLSCMSPGHSDQAEQGSLPSQGSSYALSTPAIAAPQTIRSDFQQAIQWTSHRLKSLKEACVASSAGKNALSERNINTPPIELPPVLSRLNKLIDELESCSTEKLSRPASLLARQINLDLKSPPISPETIADQEQKSSPVTQKMWKAYLAGRWEELNSLAKEGQKQEKETKKRICQPFTLMKKLSDARLARKAQNRAQFFTLQKDLMVHLDRSTCKAKHFQAKEQDWYDLFTDNILWMTRLYWQTGDLKRAETWSEKADTFAKKGSNTGLKLEALQVRYGQVGFEVYKPKKIALALQKEYKQWKAPKKDAALTAKAKEWLKTREALAWYAAKDWKKTQATLKDLPLAMAKFWILKSEIASGKPLDTLTEHISKISALDPLGFYEWEARLLLRQPMNPPPSLVTDLPPPLNVETVVSSPEKERTYQILKLAFGPDSKEHQALWHAIFTGSIVSLPEEFAPIKAWYWLQQGQPSSAVWSLFPAAIAGQIHSKNALVHLLYPRPFEDLVKKVTKECPISGNLLYSIMRQESVYDPKARSPVGALGLVQVMLSTGRRILGNAQLQPSELLDIVTNLKAGACYLNQLINRYQNNLIYTAAAYNAGEERVDQWIKTRDPLSDAHYFIESIPFTETRIYVQKVSRNHYVFEWLDKKS